MRLPEYPRPANDNGLGIHFGLDLRQVALETYIPQMVDLKLKWSLVPHQDELQLSLAARAMASAGIMPVSRFICKIDQSILDFVKFVDVLRKLNLPPYIQIFNEPGNPREWKSRTPDMPVFVQRWIQHASAVANAGGFPGLQVQDPAELRAVLAALKSAGASSVIDRLWFCPHAYGANHPPDYPYDTRNQEDHQGATVYEDDATVIGFLQFEPIFRQELGFVPPFIVGEGGWQYRNCTDSRYSAIDDQLHAQYHLTMYSSFRTGKLPTGDVLPDYVFAFCPWLLFGPEADAWYSWTAGTRRQTIIVVHSIPSFIRSFQWENGAAQPKSIQHLLLFGAPSAISTRSLLLGARKYVHQFGPTLSFSAADAAMAEHVTIVGDARALPTDLDGQLKNIGCQVERLSGDQYAVDAIFADRVARNAEFG